MSTPKSVWMDVLKWMESKDSLLPSTFPTELPAEESPDFWFRVAQVEMSTRDMLSSKVRSLITGETPPLMTSLEAWLYRRRVEWAAQLALVKATERVEPNASLSEILEWALVSSWESDWCIGLWNHAERGGKAHPENPDGLSPI